eukprot:gb/GEZJ01000068.1/.p1 GENE.gb/GEZJ01000068.1/~~gb/GEZJ01000068.1/.p1  ORF type:complete len:127 (-),score=19.34 gb/GEZJ01000068.1/:1170-1550(-)
MSAVSAEISVSISRAQNDGGGTSEYDIGANLINRTTGEQCYVSKHVEIDDNQTYNPPKELSKTSHTVRMNEGDEVSASLKMNESDPSYDDSCIDESWPYDKDSLVQKGDWTGDHDTGVFCVTFIPL